MKIDRMKPLWVLGIVVGLYWQEVKLVSASFDGFSFWTETWGIQFVDQKNSNGANLLELRVS